jgi:TldD protein
MASDFSRRDFLATGGAVVAGVFVPDWAAAFQPGTSDNARRTEVTDAALAHAAKIGASYADIRINRYRRESITTREQQVQNVSRSTSYGFGVRVLVNGAWGFAASNLVEPAAARTAAEQAVAIAKANAILAARKITLAHADRTVTTWTSAFKKDPFEVPLETKISTSPPRSGSESDVAPQLSTTRRPPR